MESEQFAEADRLGLPAKASAQARRSWAMASDWQHPKLGDVIAVNPSRPLSKGADSVYISMQQVEAANRKVSEIDHRAFKGSGSRF